MIDVCDSEISVTFLSNLTAKTKTAMMITSQITIVKIANPANINSPFY